MPWLIIATTVKIGPIHLHRAFGITERHMGGHTTRSKKEVSTLCHLLDDSEPV